MRRKARVDDNQAEVVAALRRFGCSVLCLHQIGKGAPDLAVGIGGKNFFFELKDGKKVKSARRLTDDETDFHAEWRGQIAVACSIEEILKAIGYLKS